MLTITYPVTSTAQATGWDKLDLMFNRIQLNVVQTILQVY